MSYNTAEDTLLEQRIMSWAIGLPTTAPLYLDITRTPWRSTNSLLCYVMLQTLVYRPWISILLTSTGARYSDTQSPLRLTATYLRVPIPLDATRHRPSCSAQSHPVNTNIADTNSCDLSFDKLLISKQGLTANLSSLPSRTTRWVWTEFIEKIDHLINQSISQSINQGCAVVWR